MNTARAACFVALIGAAAGVDASEVDLFDLSLTELLAVQLEDPEVSAQKRSQSVQQVPLSVSVIVGRQLDALPLVDLSAVDQLSSALTVTQYNHLTPQLYMRGIGSNTSGAGDDPSVALLLDEVVIGRPGFHTLPLFDLTRVEVLRGPQGSLYGKGVIGGAVHLLPAAPGDGAMSRVRLQLGERGSRRFDGVNNRPLSATGNNRLALLAIERDGYLDNQTSGAALGGLQQYALREQFAWRPTAGARLRLSAHLNRSDESGPAYQYAGAEPYFSGLTPNVNRRDRTELFDDGRQRLDSRLFSAHYRQQLRWAELTSISAYFDGDYDFAHQLAPLAVDGVANSASESSSQISQELRLAHSGATLEWLAGAFAMREEVERDETFDFAGLETLLGYGDLLSAESPGDTRFLASNNSNTAALFGELRWRWSARGSAQFGARYDRVGKDFGLQTSGGDPLQVLLRDSADYRVASARRWREPSYKLTVDYRWRPNFYTYLAFNTGFKAGSFNQLALDASNASASSQAETARNLEAGVKGSWLDERVRVNVSAFHIDYVDLQVFASLDSAVNAPNAEVDGVETDLTWLPLPGLQLAVNATWLDAAMAEFVTPSGIDVAGRQLPRAPRQAASVSAEYLLPGARGDWWFNLNYGYTGSYYHTVTNNAGDREAPHRVIDGAVHFQPQGRHWRVSLWGKNLGDADHSEYRQEASAFLFTAAGSTYIQAPGRSLGLALSWQN